MQDGTKIEDEISVADAHPAGNRPFERSNYIEKFQKNIFPTRAAGSPAPPPSLAPERWGTKCTKGAKGSQAPAGAGHGEGLPACARRAQNPFLC